MVDLLTNNSLTDLFDPGTTTMGQRVDLGVMAMKRHSALSRTVSYTQDTPVLGVQRIRSVHSKPH